MTTKEQYDQIKAQHLDAIILFRVGDFYEVYYEDAEKASKTLSVTLTHRGDGTPLCGFPYHALDSYLPKLVRAGYRVAICDYYPEDPTPYNEVKYGVTETIPASSEPLERPKGLTRGTAKQLSRFDPTVPVDREYLFKFRDTVAKDILARHFPAAFPVNAAHNANQLVKLLYGIDLSEQVFE